MLRYVFKIKLDSRSIYNSRKTPDCTRRPSSQTGSRCR